MQMSSQISLEKIEVLSISGVQRFFNVNEHLSVGVQFLFIEGIIRLKS